MIFPLLEIIGKKINYNEKKKKMVQNLEGYCPWSMRLGAGQALGAQLGCAGLARGAQVGAGMARACWGAQGMRVRGARGRMRRVCGARRARRRQGAGRRRARGR